MICFNKVSLAENELKFIAYLTKFNCCHIHKYYLLSIFKFSGSIFRRVTSNNSVLALVLGHPHNQLKRYCSIIKPSRVATCYIHYNPVSGSQK